MVWQSSMSMLEYEIPATSGPYLFLGHSAGNGISPGIFLHWSIPCSALFQIFVKVQELAYFNPQIFKYIF